MKRSTIVGIFVVLLVVLGVVALAWNVHYDTRTNRCLAYEPREPAGGYIHHIGGFLRGSSVVFHIWYKGETKDTKEDCQVRKNVTEGEYERIMYDR